MDKGKTKFQNWESMLHILPTLQELSTCLVLDALNEEPLDILSPRFKNLCINLNELYDCALALDYIPEPVQAVVHVLGATAHMANDCRAIEHPRYSQIIDDIKLLHRHIITLIQSVTHVEQLIGQPL